MFGRVDLIGTLVPLFIHKYIQSVSKVALSTSYHQLTLTGEDRVYMNCIDTCISHRGIAFKTEETVLFV